VGPTAATLLSVAARHRQSADDVEQLEDATPLFEWGWRFERDDFRTVPASAFFEYAHDALLYFARVYADVGERDVFGATPVAAPEQLEIRLGPYPALISEARKGNDLQGVVRREASRAPPSSRAR
jgi:hypothetical protein